MIIIKDITSRDRDNGTKSRPTPEKLFEQTQTTIAEDFSRIPKTKTPDGTSTSDKIKTIKGKTAEKHQLKLF